MDKATRKYINDTAKCLASSKKLVAKLEAEFAELRLKALRTVEMTKEGNTITLTSGKRVIKAKKPARYNDRYDIQENGKMIAKEYFGNIHDIRFAIAMGQI